MSLKKLQIFTERRNHLPHPIPYSLKVHPIGRTLTEHEWQRFTNRLLSPRLVNDCHRQINGDIFFIGEGGLEAAGIFQRKFNGRFRMRMICDKKTTALESLHIAENLGLKVQEVFFEDDLGTKVRINDERIIEQQFQIH